MAMHIDHKYVGLLSGRLERFKRKDNNLYNFRCVFCGDSQKNKWKARGYIYPHKGGLNYKCHNCHVSVSLGKLIEHLDPELYKEYCLERYKEGVGIGPAHKAHSEVKYNFKKPEFEETKKQSNVLDLILDCVKNLDSEHEAVKFLEKRKIPKEAYSELYYIDDVSKLEQLSEKYRERISGTESRLVIPFFTRKGKMFALTCRALGNESLRYLTIKIDEDQPLVYGIDRVDTTKNINVVEGPLDSWFLPNCLAVAGSDLKKIQHKLPKDRTRIIPDNQPRNKDVVRYMRGCADRGFQIVVWPDTIYEKDVNDMIKDGGMSPDRLLEIINENTYTGLAATAAINKWSKV